MKRQTATSSLPKVSTGKVINRAISKAIKPVDKLQNKVLKKLNRKVNTLVGQKEVKYTSANTGAISINGNGGWISTISKDIVNGTTDNQRIGDKINMLSIHFKGTINLPQGLNTAIVRLILVRYHETFYQTSPDSTKLLLTGDYRSFYKPETQKDQYSIIFDKTYNLYQTNRQQLYIKIHKSLCGAKAGWDTGSMLNGPASGHLFLYYIGDSNPTQPNPFIDLTYMLYYND